MHNLHENKLHGQPEFPFIVYRGMLPEYITGYPLHWHEEMELISVVSGTGIITVQAERFEVHGGDLILIPPQTVHSIEQLDGERMEYFNILFQLSLLEAEHGVSKYIRPLYSHSKTLPFYLPQGDALNENLAFPVAELIRNRKRVDSDYTLMIRANLYTILYHIVHERLDGSVDTVPMDTNYDKLKVILEYLREHYSEEITVQQVADMCGFSGSHFMKLFRELTGTSFVQYVKHLRLDAAARQLRETGRRIGEIAEEVGFSNLSYFTRAFEEKYHVTPSAYRQNGRQ